MADSQNRNDFVDIVVPIYLCQFTKSIRQNTTIAKVISGQGVTKEVHPKITLTSLMLEMTALLVMSLAILAVLVSSCVTATLHVLVHYALIKAVLP